MTHNRKRSYVLGEIDFASAAERYNKSKKFKFDK